MRHARSRIGTHLDNLPAAWALSLGATAAAAVVGPWALRGELVPAWIAGGGCLGVAVLLAARGRPVVRLAPMQPLPQPAPGERPVVSPPTQPVPDERPTLPVLDDVLDEPLEMIELTGGTFRMGSPKHEKGRCDNESPMHEVTVSAFAMAKVPTTQQLYREIMRGNPSSPQGDDLPVNNVSFFDAVLFCNRLSEKAGLLPCYAINGNEVAWNRGANGYRLPTEAEWEYAARAGTTTRYSFGDDEAALGDYAWFSQNARTIQPVGRKRPNRWGLHDIHGNVWEWCWDQYGPYANQPERDPVGPLRPPTSLRVLRGGAWDYVPQGLRSASRYWVNPDDRSRDVGFRCVRGSRRPPGG